MYTVWSCDDYDHEGTGVVYTKSGQCPLCDALSQINELESDLAIAREGRDDAQNELNDAQKEVSRLELDISQLKNEKS